MDNNIIGGDEKFMALEDKEVACFKRKPRTLLSRTSPLHFNGMNIRMDSDEAILIDMSEHFPRLETVPKTKIDKLNFVTARLKAAHTVKVNMPDLAYEFASASQVKQTTITDVHFINRAILTLTSEPATMRLE